ncbi:CHASE2 domain-containing protein [Kangiella sp. HZ709]|uniref:CHASE2 domain-containing protein n=1 Tax=Kangiella sp. HZ709 TaxID=2666328 RepID=UPI0012AFCC51|nr:CHASE2 domain-containing protein [Kangiella sp. HZ709]MRX28148.1 CHASE2 domain-containing protein [Kangiella sp. HZ709]
MDVNNIKPTKSYSHYILAAVFAAFTFYVSYSQWLLPLDYLFYDRILRLQPDTNSEDVVIVAMDELSLQEYGQLPWNRTLHAQLIDQLSKSEVKAVGYDVLFDKNRDLDDQVLVDAVKNNGKVVFPVIIEKLAQNRELLEVMPFPDLIQAAKKMGVVHFELDSDNIARSSYLKAGLGEPFWRSFSAEVLEVSSDTVYALPINEKSKSPSYDLTIIEKDGLIYIPYKKNQNHFKKISFVDVVQGKQTALDAIKNKVVFVGVTATAARNADFLPVPMSRDGQIMPGVEINATLFEALKDESYIEAMPNVSNSLILTSIVLVFFVFLPKLLPRRSFYYSAIILLAIIFLQWYLMHFQYLWFKVATLIAVISVGYLFWVWQKVVSNMTFFKATVERLNIEMEHSLKPEPTKNITAKLSFLAQLNLIEKKALKSDFNKINDQRELYNQLLKLEKTDSRLKDKRLLRRIIKEPKEESVQANKSYGVIESRVKTLDEAISQINFLRRFVEQTMNRMSDGVILVDMNGLIFYSNLIAKRYVPRLSKDKELSLKELFGLLQLKRDDEWSEPVLKVLKDGIQHEFTASINKVLDVKVSISLIDNLADNDFIVINMVDISEIKREQRRQLEMIDFISHDLRSPMTSILALLNKNYNDSSTAELSIIHREIEKLTRSSLNLAEQFLMLSRVESNAEAKPYPIELLSTIDNAIAIVTPQASNASINIEFDFMAYEDIWLLANQDMLERVIINLLTNAIKYSPTDTQVTVLIEVTPLATLVKVCDQGDGIDQEQMEAIFKPFSRMQKHEVTKINGIGLGLRFVKAVMIRLGGKVTVESCGQKNKSGSTFTLEFPNHLLVKD